jgi:hypothetical protein
MLATGSTSNKFVGTTLTLVRALPLRPQARELEFPSPSPLMDRWRLKNSSR